MLTRKRHSWIVVLLTVAVLFVASTTLAMAKTSVKKVVYQGSGKVEVYYKSSVTYEDSVKVTAKDNSNKTYKTVIKSKEGSKIVFQIKSYKSGKTYKVTVNGISSSGDAVTSFKIYSKSSAVKTAKSKSKATSIKNVQSKDDKYNGYGIWRITFTGKYDGETYKYTYLIKQQTGKVMNYSREKV